MTRKLTIALLTIALLWELMLSFVPMFAPEFALHQFGIVSVPKPLFLAFVVGWLCLFVSLICGLLLYRIYTRRGDYSMPGYLLGFWWIAIGIAIWAAFGKPGNLLTDSLKGLLLVVLIYRLQTASRAGIR